MVALTTPEQNLLDRIRHGEATFTDAATIPVASAGGPSVEESRTLLDSALKGAGLATGIKSGMGTEEVTDRVIGWVIKNFEAVTDVRAGPYTLPQVLSTRSGNCMGLATLCVALAEQYGVELSSAFAVTPTLQQHIIPTLGERPIEPLLKAFGIEINPNVYPTLIPNSLQDFVALLYANLARPGFGPASTDGDRVDRTLIEKALLFSPKHPFVSLAYATLNGPTQEALQQVSAVIETHPDFPYATLERALALREMGRNDETLPVFRSLLKVFPLARILHVYISEALEGRGMLKEARDELNNFLATRAYSVGVDPAHYFNLARLEYVLGNSSRALDLLGSVEKVAERLSTHLDIQEPTRTGYRILAANAMVNAAAIYSSYYEDDRQNTAALQSAILLANNAVGLIPDHPAALYSLISLLRRETTADKNIAPYLWSQSIIAADRLLKLGDAATNPQGVPFVTCEGVGYKMQPIPVTPDQIASAHIELEKMTNHVPEAQVVLERTLNR